MSSNVPGTPSSFHLNRSPRCRPSSQSSMLLSRPRMVHNSAIDPAERGPTEDAARRALIVASAPVASPFRNCPSARMSFISLPEARLIEAPRVVYFVWKYHNTSAVPFGNAGSLDQDTRLSPVSRKYDSKYVPTTEWAR